MISAYKNILICKQQYIPISLEQYIYVRMDNYRSLNMKFTHIFAFFNGQVKAKLFCHVLLHITSLLDKTGNTKRFTVKITLSLLKYFHSLIRQNCPFIRLSVHQSVNSNMNLFNRLIVHYAIKIQTSPHISCLNILQQIHSNYPHFRPRRNL